MPVIDSSIVIGVVDDLRDVHDLDVQADLYSVDFTDTWKG